MPLLVTDEMIKTARGGKAIVLLTMPAQIFLELTTQNPSHLSEIFREAQPLAVYNDRIEKGDTRIIPYLKIEEKTGKIWSHEGRHRAAALIKAEGPQAEIAVSIFLTDESNSLHYYDSRRVPHPPYILKRFLGLADIPAVIHGQFADVTYPISDAIEPVELWVSESD